MAYDFPKLIVEPYAASEIYATGHRQQKNGIVGFSNYAIFLKAQNFLMRHLSSFFYNALLFLALQKCYHFLFVRHRIKSTPMRST